MTHRDAWDQGARAWRRPPEPDAPGPRTTPGTRLTWEGVGGWIRAYLELGLRQDRTQEHYARERAHLEALTEDVIAAEQDPAALEYARRIVRSEQPHRGARAGHITTRQLDWIHARLARLARAA